MSDRNNEYDVFICHASEDKKDFVRPLALALRSQGLKVWYDEFSLEVGDSLSKNIEKGLASSTYGIVVISPSFIDKPWTDRELGTLYSLQDVRGFVCILEFVFL